MTRSTSAARKARNACMWCARWFLEISIALVITGLVAAMLFSGGCSPRADVDTNGDGKPDTAMNSDEIAAWQARDAAASKAKADKIEADAKAAIAKQEAALAQAKRIQRDAERAMARQNNANAEHLAQIKADAEDQIDDLNVNVAEAIDAIHADATNQIAALKLEWQAREDSRTAALASIEQQATWFNAIANDPTIRSTVGNLPGGGIALGLISTVGGLVFGHRSGKTAGATAGESKGWDDGYAAGLAAGKQQGVSEGRDIGWQERAEHQAEIDKTYEEALNRAGKVAA